MDFKKRLHVLRSLELTIKNKEFSFPKFCSFIQRKDIKDIVGDLLKSINLSIKKEVVLTIYLISGYSKYVLNNTPLDIEIKEMSDDIINYINSNCEKNNLSNKLVLFLSVFFNSFIKPLIFGWHISR